MKTSADQQDFFAELLETEIGMSPGMANMSSVFIEPMLRTAMPVLVPTVGQHNTKRLTDGAEAFRFVMGFKDGLVQLTGDSSKIHYCNANVSASTQTYYWNWHFLFQNKDVVEANFDAANRDASLRSFFTYWQSVLRWPFNTLYSCYWAQVLLYVPYRD